jgi:hypothetical protein
LPIAIQNTKIHIYTGIPDGFAILQEKYHEMRENEELTIQSKMREK